MQNCTNLTNHKFLNVLEIEIKSLKLNKSIKLVNLKLRNYPNFAEIDCSYLNQMTIKYEMHYLKNID